MAPAPSRRRLLPPSRRTALLLTVATALLATLLASVVGVSPVSASVRGTPSEPTDPTDPTALMGGLPTTGTTGRPAGPSARARQNPDRVQLPDACRTPKGYLKPKKCTVLPHRPGAPTVVVWGDSHAWQMVPALRAAIGDRPVNLVSFLQGACPPMNSRLQTEQERAEKNSCDVMGKTTLRYLRHAMKKGRTIRLVVALSWELYHDVTDEPNADDVLYPGYSNDFIRTNAHKALTGVPRAFRTLGNLKVPTDLVGQMPMVYENAPSCPAGRYRCDLPRRGTMKDEDENLATARRMRSVLVKPAKLIQPSPFFCTNRVCKGTVRGVPAYYDQFHIGARASET